MLQRIVTWYYRRQIQKGVRVLKNLDGMMIRAGYNRHSRRVFRRSVVNNEKIREDLLQRLSR